MFVPNALNTPSLMMSDLEFGAAFPNANAVALSAALLKFRSGSSHG